ncbi:MAG: multiheme c-type cytochrome, partial [Acidobacteriota bacterium]
MTPRGSAPCPRGRRLRRLAAGAAWLACALAAGAAWAGGENLDPTKVVTVEACGECHVSAFEVWKKTPHATGFKTMHRQRSAAQISARMGEKLIKRDSVCVDCHYTPQLKGGAERAVSGVSCESCHGAGLDWMEIHNDYGGKGVDHTTETPEHRARRIEESVRLGMRRPSNLYATAASCFRCHTVPNEKLVNVGKHSIGSSGFELVEWSHGEIRHNFLASFLDGDGTENAVRPPEHDRRMYVTGRALAVEYSLRGLATATENGVYAKAMQRRLRSAVVELRAIDQVGDLPDVASMVDAVRAVKPAVGQSAAMLAAADQIGAATRRFLERHDGTRLATLDPLLVDGAAAVELEDDEPEEEIRIADAAAPAAPGAPAVDGDPPPDAPAAGPAPPRTRVVREAVPAEGDRRSHIRPRSAHGTLEVSACQKCHGDQNAWWFDDRHFASIDPFLDRGAKPVTIARLYGLSPKEMVRGDSICMDCHGSVAAGRASRKVQDGVSCQSCHGPAADYLEVHQEGDESLGRERTGYQKAIQVGMKDLYERQVRVKNCASCHYITDPRLISSGHPTGVDFDIADGIEQIRHCSAPPTTPGPCARRGPPSFASAGRCRRCASPASQKPKPFPAPRRRRRTPPPAPGGRRSSPRDPSGAAPAAPRAGRRRRGRGPRPATCRRCRRSTTTRPSAKSCGRSNPSSRASMKPSRGAADHEVGKRIRGRGSRPHKEDHVKDSVEPLPPEMSKTTIR